MVLFLHPISTSSLNLPGTGLCCEPCTVRTGKRLEQELGARGVAHIHLSHTLRSEPPVLMRAELMFGPGESGEEKSHGVTGLLTS